MAEYQYERIASGYQRQIMSGELQPGARLPTQEEMCDEFGVSRVVARQVLTVLENQGLIDRVRGGGAFVRRYQPLVRRSAQHYKTNPGAPFAEEALAAERIPSYKHETRPTHAEEDIAVRLNIPMFAEVMQTDYVSAANDEPMMVVHSYEPLALTKGTPVERPEEGPYMTAGLVDRFTAIGLRPTRVVERMRARMPWQSEVDLLHLKPGTPVMVIVRKVYSGDTVIETADILLNSHKYELEYELTVPSA